MPISMHILYTGVHTFPKALTRRIVLTIKSIFSWWSFPLFSWPLYVIQGWYCKEKLDARLTLIFLPKGTIKNVVYLLIVTWLMNSSLVHVYRQVSNLNNLPSKQALLKGTRPNQLWNEQRRKCDCPHQMENRACWHLPWTRLSNSFYFWLKKNLVFLTQSCESGKKCCLGFKVLLVKLCAQIPGWLFLKAANHKTVA